MNEFDSIKWAQQQLDNAEFRLRNFKYNQTALSQYTQNPYSEAEDNPPPFFVTLRKETTIEVVDGEDQPVSNYKVTVAEGYIAEKNRSQGAANALVYHLCDNFFEAGEPKEFPITEEEAVFVTFTEDEDAVIDANTAEIQILPKDTKPIEGNQFHYKLAELEPEDGDLVIKPFLMGSHIYHTESAIPPFYVTLKSTTEIVEGVAETSYTVSVNDGYVIERKLHYPVADALAYFYCSPLVDQTIVVGKMVAVRVVSNTNGSIATASIMVVDATTVSIGADPDNAGTYYYKLAEFQGGNQIIPVAMGSHIYHPTGLTGDVRFTDCQDYDMEGNPIGDPEQRGRLIFVSGMLSALGTPIDDWPEMENVMKIELPMCSGSAMP